MSIQQTRFDKAVLTQHQKHGYNCLRAFGDNPQRVVQSMQRWIEKNHKLSNDFREKYHMVKKTETFGNFKGFIDCKLDGTHHEAYEAWDIHDSDIFDILSTVTEGGYKVSFSYQAQQHNFLAAVTGTDAAGKNAGWCVSAYAPDMYNAIRLVLFKATVILPEVWSDYKPSGRNAMG